MSKYSDTYLLQTLQRWFKAVEITEIIYHKYFAGIKMRGNFDDTFFDSINKVFICFVTTAMHHCLKVWETEIYIEPPKIMEFKYDTSVSKWRHTSDIPSALSEYWLQ